MAYLVSHRDRAWVCLAGEKFGVKGIPMLAVVGTNGELVTADGRQVS
jgi:hypothetical protein